MKLIHIDRVEQVQLLSKKGKSTTISKEDPDIA